MCWQHPTPHSRHSEHNSDFHAYEDAVSRRWAERAPCGSYDESEERCLRTNVVGLIMGSTRLFRRTPRPPMWPRSGLRIIIQQERDSRGGGRTSCRFCVGILAEVIRKYVNGGSRRRPDQCGARGRTEILEVLGGAARKGRCCLELASPPPLRRFGCAVGPDRGSCIRRSTRIDHLHKPVIETWDLWRYLHFSHRHVQSVMQLR